MIKQVVDFLNEFKEQKGTFDRVLEVGSRKVNSDHARARDILGANKEYIGIDLVADEQSVDIVMNGHDIKKKFEKESFDVVVTCETLEHDDKFWQTIENMRWVLKPGGWMIVTVPGPHCPFHEWPGDYWRFMKDGVDKFFVGFENNRVIDMCWGGDHFPSNADAVMGWGQKPPGDPN